MRLVSAAASERFAQRLQQDRMQRQLPPSQPTELFKRQGILFNRSQGDVRIGTLHVLGDELKRKSILFNRSQGDVRIGTLHVVGDIAKRQGILVNRSQGDVRIGALHVLGDESKRTTGTGNRSQRFVGQENFDLDPFGITGDLSHSLNWLDALNLHDEFVQLGRFAAIEQNIAILRDYDATLWLLLQDLSQLRGVCTKWESFLANTTL
ncbi:hypothetical protein Q3G72_001651 [Acer saccharum]|nr:hypothetical protein Q3G72_001651 [Acer saccharum]